jgi:predicted Rossmann fold flavoprotein
VRHAGDVLFTHRGLSGPAALQASLLWAPGTPLSIDLLPGVDTRAWLAGERRSRATLATLLAQRLPRRFAQQWCAAHALEGAMTELPDRALEEAARSLGDWRVQPSGTLGYNKAEVTLGGVDTRALSSKTMEASAVPGLHFIGEAVDVTGHLGGFNFQWAWASAHAAGSAL